MTTTRFVVFSKKTTSFAECLPGLFIFNGLLYLKPKPNNCFLVYDMVGNAYSDNRTGNGLIDATSEVHPCSVVGFSVAMDEKEKEDILKELKESRFDSEYSMGTVVKAVEK